MIQEKLHRFHIALLVFNTQSGVVLFTLPRLTAIYFGTNGWLAILIMALLVGINIMLISAVYRLGDGASVFQILESSLPKILLYPLYLFIGSVFAMIGCLVVKQYVLIYQMLFFQATSDMTLKLVIDILLFLLVSKGIYTMAKANTFFVFILFLQVPLALFFFGEFDSVRLTPFLFRGGSDMMKGALEIYGAYMGYELTFFLFPYAEKTRKWLKYIHLGNGLTTFIYLLAALISYGVYNVQELTHLAFPLLDMSSYIQFPFIERMQNILYSFFLLSVLQTGGMYYWSSLTVFTRMLPRVPWRVTLFITMVVTISISMIPKSLTTTEAWFRPLTFAQMCFSVSFPLLLILLLVIQKGRNSHG